ncbi:pitrilysin family protein [Lentimicrobium sp.]|uniref:M16 family metallopeptidase n=1 Tax=Lentimicrobium sp. TaxID=2034841 RepID=UPI002C99DE80|nr:pitrilysin family protein [Lentimicrobium sp.]HRW68715.1 pitrilysin family protein [Lentimicrobium sp.]
MQYQFHTLPNGIRIVHRHSGRLVAHLAVMVNTGSRDELPGEEGLAHFIEHVIFKGTGKRKVYQVLGRLENIGADLNAYTTKEETCIHASFLSTYYARAIELFADILFNSTFPEKEINKEKDVVIDEINAYKDSPSELIFDEFEEMLFRGHPLGKSILGSPASVKRINRKRILGFIANHYHTNQIVISSVGNIRFDWLVKLVNEAFGCLPENLRTDSRQVFTASEPKQLIKPRRNFQTHCILGNHAYGYADARRTALALLTNLLGGPAMNSRLSMALRERHGLSYNIESVYTPYAETGSFMIYLGTDNGSLDKALTLVRAELDKFIAKSLGTIQLHTAKQQFIGQIAISFESNLNDALSMAKSMLVYDTVDTHEVLISKINAITADLVLEVAHEIFDPSGMSMLVYKNRKA